MLIFWKPRLAFLANSRVGSTSIEMALESMANLAVQRPDALRHTDLRQFRDHLAPWLSASAGARFETIAVVREPLDWLGSWYRDRRRARREPETGLPEGQGDAPAWRGFARLADSADGESFADFARAYLAMGDEAPCQRDFLTTPQGARVDHLFRYDALDDLVAFLEDRLDCALTLPRLRQSPEASVALPEDLRRQVQQRLAADRAIYDSAMHMAAPPVAEPLPFPG